MNYYDGGEDLSRDCLKTSENQRRYAGNWTTEECRLASQSNKKLAQNRLEKLRKIKSSKLSKKKYFEQEEMQHQLHAEKESAFNIASAITKSGHSENRNGVVDFLEEEDLDEPSEHFKSGLFDSSSEDEKMVVSKCIPKQQVASFDSEEEEIAGLHIPIRNFNN